MKNSGRSSPGTKRNKISTPEKPSFPPPLQRAIAVGAGLFLGGYLVVTHQTLFHTLAGFALWAVAISLSLVWFPQVPGAEIFSRLLAPGSKGNHEWSLGKITLVGTGVLAALGLSNYFLGQTRVWFFLLSLLILGWCLTLLEDHLPRPLGDQVSEPSVLHRFSFPWSAVAILLCGSFFLFYRWHALHIGYDTDGIKSLELAEACVSEFTTPYVDGWVPGNPIFPYFLMGIFFKLVGISFDKGVLFIALLNLAGFLFFYGFARFYLPKLPALAATLFFSMSHWVIYPAREITGIRGMLVPFECAVLFFFARALESGKARDYALFGTLLAVSVLIGLQNWILVLLFILALSIFWIFRPSLIQNQKWSWALALLVALLWYFPILLHFSEGNAYGFFMDQFNTKSVWHGPRIPWDSVYMGLRMFNVGSQENLVNFLPLLSPWEGIFFLAGLGFCLRRFFRLSSLFVILGFLGGLAPAILTIVNTTLRSLTAVPFVFLLVGIGLDRLGMVLTAPLGRRGRAWGFLLGGAILVLAAGWHFDAFFNQIPRYKDSYWIPNGRAYLFGTITAKHLQGWDTYVDLWDGTYLHPENNYFYSRADMEKGRRIIFRPDQSPLPLKNIPEKGALILFPDKLGKTYRDSINYYYPAAQEKEILNPFGDVEFRSWEISPVEIQEALKRPAPLEGMTLGYFDAQGRKLGQWQIPTLSAELLNEEWFAPCTDKPPFPSEKIAYFVVQGSLENPAGKVLAFETSGRADGFIGNRKIQLDGQGSLKRFEIPLHSKKPDHFEIRYFLPKEGRFDLNLWERTPLGWDMVPSSELNP